MFIYQRDIQAEETKEQTKSKDLLMKRMKKMIVKQVEQNLEQKGESVLTTILPKKSSDGAKLQTALKRIRTKRILRNGANESNEYTLEPCSINFTERKDS